MEEGTEGVIIHRSIQLYAAMHAARNGFPDMGQPRVAVATPASTAKTVSYALSSNGTSRCHRTLVPPSSPAQPAL